MILNKFLDPFDKHLNVDGPFEPDFPLIFTGRWFFLNDNRVIAGVFIISRMLALLVFLYIWRRLLWNLLCHNHLRVILVVGFYKAGFKINQGFLIKGV